MLIAVSTFVIILLAAGYRFRYHRKWHIMLMLSAFIIDLSLVLVIETNRNVLEKLTTKDVLFLTYFHAGVSTAVLILYVLLITLGIIFIRKPDKQVLKLHRRTGIFFLCCRLINYFTSFFIAG